MSKYVEWFLLPLMGNGRGHSLPGIGESVDNIEKVYQMSPVPGAHRVRKAFAF